MFELLLTAAGSGGKEIENSGPGPKTIILGNENHGYFGEFDSTLLFSAEELIDKTVSGVSLSNVPNSLMWLKFIINGKILFLPKTQICTGVSWIDLYELGLVYGTDDNGLYPTDNPTNQMVVVNKGKDGFKVRLPTGRNMDPSPNTVAGNWNEVTLESEFVKTYGALSSATTPLKPAGVAQWNKFNNNVDMQFNLGPNTYTLVQESNSISVAVSTFGFSPPAVTVVYNKTRGGAWRPVLELIPNNGELLSIDPSDNIIQGAPLINTSTPIIDSVRFGSIEFMESSANSPIVYLNKES